MQQSNAYVIIYTVVLTVVCAVLLTLAAVGLKPYQDRNIELEKKQNILATVMTVETREAAEKIYAKRVKSYVIDFKGNILKDQVAEKIDLLAEYKKKPETRVLPVYEILNEQDPSKTDFFVLPLFGFGLWDNIWGYVALKGDLNTINGVVLDHKAETKGLGARIETAEVRDRFKDKKIFEGDKLVSITLAKGEQGGGNASVAIFKDKPHEVDGMSGATLTGKGVNNMLKEYFGCYEQFIKAKIAKK